MICTQLHICARCQKQVHCELPTFACPWLNDDEDQMCNDCVELYAKEIEEFELKTREGDQPLPTKNDLPYIQELVQKDIEERKAIGLKRYGTLLQPHNGRDFLLDAYQEAIDLVMYLRGLMFERDGK